MKIKVKELSFDKVLLEKAYEHKKPKKPNIIAIQPIQIIPGVTQDNLTPSKEVTSLNL